MRFGKRGTLRKGTVFKPRMRGASTGGPVVKTPGSQRRGPGFNPWSGNWVTHATAKTAKLNKQINTNKYFKNLGCRNSILKSRDIILPTKVRLVKAMVFPVVMYGCESWTVKKPEELMLLNCGV